VSSVRRANPASGLHRRQMALRVNSVRRVRIVSHANGLRRRQMALPVSSVRRVSHASGLHRRQMGHRVSSVHRVRIVSSVLARSSGLIVLRRRVTETTQRRRSGRVRSVLPLPRAISQGLTIDQDRRMPPIKGRVARNRLVKIVKNRIDRLRHNRPLLHRNRPARSPTAANGLNVWIDGQHLRMPVCARHRNVLRRGRAATNRAVKGLA